MAAVAVAAAVAAVLAAVTVATAAATAGPPAIAAATAIVVVIAEAEAIAVATVVLAELERVFQLHDGKINDLRVAEGFAVTASDDKFLRVWPTDFSDFFLEAEHESAVRLFLFTYGQLD